jgi:hypothetical protein
LVFVAAQVNFHRRTLKALEWRLSEQAPKEYEVVSSESRVTDRERKPQLYAPTGIQRGLLTAPWPFPIEIDLDAIELPGQ